MQATARAPLSTRRAGLAARPSLPARAGRARTVQTYASSSGYKWLNVEPLAVALGTLGWIVPAASPSPSYGGGSLFGAFTSTIGSELAKFPTGPSIDSPFWLQLVVFHLGLFVCMTLAQIGIQGRKQGYF